MIQHMAFHRFKSLHDTALDARAVNLLIGANAAGKSNVIRVFRFLSEAIRKDVESAIAPLGGMEGACFLREPKRAFSLEMVYYVPDPSAPSSRSDMSYRLTVGDRGGRPSVLDEELRIKRDRDARGRAKIWLKARLGKGKAVRDPQSGECESFDTGDPGVLALKALGFLDAYPRIRALRTFVESWQFLSVNLEAVRAPRRDMRAETLDYDAANLVNVLRTIRGSDAYTAILDDLESRIDTIESVDTEVDEGRVTLLLKDAAFKDPVEVLSVSDGTLRLLALDGILAWLGLKPVPHTDRAQDPKGTIARAFLKKTKRTYRTRRARLQLAEKSTGPSAERSESWATAVQELEQCGRRSSKKRAAGEK